MLTWFDQLSLRAKLALGFGALIGLMLIGGGSGLWSHARARAAVEAYLEGDHRIDALSLESSAAMGKARRYEKEFLLKVREFSYEEAKSRYATLVASQLAVVRENMATIRSLTGNPEIAAQSRTIEDVTRRYEAGFLRVVELYGSLGRVHTGLEGQFRTHAHAIEALLTPDTPERLRTGLLSLRRHEKDYILRGLNRDAQAFELAAVRFENDLAQSGLPGARRDALRLQLGQYRVRFQDYVRTADQIDADTLVYLGAVHTIEPQLEQLHAHVGAAVAATRETLRHLNQAATMTLLAVGLGAILLGILVATYIVRNTKNTVSACVDFAGRLADGEQTARLPSIAGNNEFSILATALNRMADAVRETHARDELHARDMARLNRTLRLVSICNETLVRARSEAELLDAICRHVVEGGGYRLAWVGFARHDEGRCIEPVAIAAQANGRDEAQHYVAELGLTWGEDERRHGVGGLAIRQGQPALARDIARDPVFAPWRARALACGFASCLALPLHGKGEVLGTLSIYSSETDAFDAEELRLLQNFADDLAFGVLGLREAVRREQAEQALDYQARYDAVTGLVNRRLFGERLQQATLLAARAGHQVGVMVLGLDRFKAVNDSLGHGAGDALLQHVGRCLKTALRESDTVARLAGDEFAIAIGELQTQDDAVPVALKLLATVLEPMMFEGHNVYTSASMGISFYPKDGAQVDSLLRNADTARSSAKSMGGNVFRFYAADMNERVSTMFAMETELRRALAQDELRVYFQPRVNLASGEICAAEALVRWQHPERGLVPPAEFIALAEDTGLIQPLGEWMIHSVCRQQRAWLDAGTPVCPVAVNLSARQFRQKNLAQVIADALRDNQLDAHCLEMELTESALMDNLDEAAVTLHALRATGIKLSLDDFGTGHSSLSRLRRLPIDHLKIDQSFVRNLTTDPQDAAICLAIIGLAHNLHMTVIAEGVETEGQATYLRRHHCDEMQGYYFSRPVPAVEFERLLTQRKTLNLPLQSIEQRNTLLLVDDEANILGALKRLLRRDGYHIVTAASAREALALLSTQTVQVIVSDQLMPEMTGTDFLSRVRELYPNTVRLVLSGFSDLDSVVAAINRGAIYKFISKPWDGEALRIEVREAFRHHALMQRGVASTAAATVPEV